MSDDGSDLRADSDAALGHAVQGLIEVASRDEQGLHALKAIRDALGAAIDLRRSEAKALADASREVVPIDAAQLAALIDQAAESLAVGVHDPMATALGRADRSPESAPAGGSSPLHRTAEGAADSREDRDAHLPGLSERAQVKADLSRACAASIESGVPVDVSLILRARSLGASTWMADLIHVAPHDLHVLADCFTALSEVAEYTSALRHDGPLGRERFPHAVQSMAAVVSALRVAVLHFRQTADEDQLAGFAWLRETTAEDRIFVARHMRINDPYDPEDVGSVVRDIHEELELIREATARRERRKKAIGRVRYHAGLIGRDRGGERDRQKVIDAVEELVADGLAPSSLELRDVLLPIRFELPAAGAQDSGYARVLEQLDLHLSRIEVVPEDDEREDTPSAQVQQVADLLAGTEMVVIGGELRVEAERRLREGFGLSGLTWLHLTDDPSNEDFARAIVRDEVSVVVLLVRWAKHRYGNAGEIADLHHKPFVRVTGGYNPNAIASAIMQQASDRLTAMRRERNVAHPDASGSG